MHYDYRFLVYFVTGYITDYWLRVHGPISLEDDNFRNYVNGAINHCERHLRGETIYGATPDVYCTLQSDAEAVFGRQNKRHQDMAIANVYMKKGTRFLAMHNEELERVLARREEKARASS